MPLLLLNDKKIRATKAPTQGRLELWDSHTRGLCLRITPSDTRTWVYRYRVGGRGTRHRRLTLGAFPDTLLAAARKRARAVGGRVSDGRDPAAEQADERRSLAAAGSFGELAERYLDYVSGGAYRQRVKDAKPRKRSWREDERILRVELLPRWRHHRVKELRRADIRAVVERIADRAPVMANRTLAVISRLLNWALERDWIEANPAHRIAKPGEETSRDRVLTDAELRELWAALGETARMDDQERPVARLNSLLNAAFRLRLLTAQRGGEVFRMRWADVDLAGGWWTIPATLSKNGEPHRVPLVKSALAILRSLREAADPQAVWVFGTERGGNIAHRGKKAASFLSRGDAHVRTARSQGLRRPRYQPGLSFTFRGHDLRRTAASGMAEAGVPRDHISRVLNHIDAGPRATRVYDRYAYDREKRAALEAWERSVTRTLTGAQADNVVPFR